MVPLVLDWCSLVSRTARPFNPLIPCCGKSDRFGSLGCPVRLLGARAYARIEPFQQFAAPCLHSGAEFQRGGAQVDIRLLPHHASEIGKFQPVLPVLACGSKVEIGIFVTLFR
jgi:hypothetical protein